MDEVKRRRSEERRKRDNERYKRLRNQKKKKIKEHEALCSYLRETCPKVLEDFYAARCSAENLPSSPNCTTTALQTSTLEQIASSTNPTTTTITTTTLQTPLLRQTDLTSIMSSTLKPEETLSLDFEAHVPNVYGEDEDIINVDLSYLLDNPFS